jgi:hypothetical protein
LNAPIGGRRGGLTPLALHEFRDILRALERHIADMEAALDELIAGWGPARGDPGEAAQAVGSWLGGTRRTR